MTALRLHGSFGEAFHAMLTTGRLHYARCPVCSAVLGYSARVCPQGHLGAVWTPAAGGATLRALTVYHQAYSSAFPAPYAVALVELDEGPVLVAAIDAGAGALGPGARLAARVDACSRLVFVPA